MSSKSIELAERVRMSVSRLQCAVIVIVTVTDICGSLFLVWNSGPIIVAAKKEKKKNTSIIG